MGPLYDIIYKHPQWIAIACVSWIALAIWILSLVGWMVQGEVDVLFGFLGVALALILGYFSFMPPAEVLRPFTALSIVATVIVFPILRTALNNRELVAIDVEAMENAYELLRQKPENHLIRFKLAKLLYGRGQLEASLGVGAEALRGMPENLFTEEHRIYARWKRQNLQVNLAAPIRCLDCGHPNPPADILCQQCGRPHLLDRARGKMVGSQFARKLMTGWIVGIMALIGIPLASSLPPIAAIVVMIAIMVGAITLILMSFRSKEGAASA